MNEYPGKPEQTAANDFQNNRAAPTSVRNEMRELCYTTTHKTRESRMAVA